MLPLRLLVATSAIGGLAIAGLAPAPAHAAAPIDGGSLELTSSLNYDGADCSGATAPSDVTAAYTAGTTVKRTLSFDQTATAADPTDSVRMKGSQTTTISSTVAGGQLSSLTATSSVTGSVTATKAVSACDPTSDFPISAGPQTEFHAQVNRTTAGWLHIQATSAGVGGQVTVVGFGGEALVQTQSVGYSVRDLSYDSWIYVPAGENQLQLVLGGIAADGFGIANVSLKQTVRLTFAPAGVARSATVGAARSKVVFPGALTCSTGKAVARLTSAVRGASRVAFYVNGVRKVSYVRPGARTVVLTGVPRNRSVTLKAVVKDGRRLMAAARSYRSC